MRIFILNGMFVVEDPVSKRWVLQAHGHLCTEYIYRLINHVGRQGARSLLAARHFMLAAIAGSCGTVLPLLLRRWPGHFRGCRQRTQSELVVSIGCWADGDRRKRKEKHAAIRLMRKEASVEGLRHSKATNLVISYITLYNVFESALAIPLRNVLLSPVAVTRRIRPGNCHGQTHVNGMAQVPSHGTWCRGLNVWGLYK